ncbi:terpene synthase-like [Leptidea sinapis]|uniref:terpene synthase-like n=1 Tax=Leptidea sinapis TaxID=189913 RepID=UPI0021C317EA|nr:terpene synthase-like [Leptidea sinapis]
MSGQQDKDSEFDEQLLLPFTYVYQMPGKAMRKRIGESFNHWLHVPQDKLEEVIEIVGMYHHCTLIADDVQDNTKHRRGIPAAHTVYGMPITVNAANHVMMLVLEKCMQLHEKGALIFREQTIQMLRGQGKEIYWRDNFICPTEDQYMTHLTQKTGDMFLFCFRLLQLFSDSTIDYSGFVRKLGMYFQLRDDYCNICQPKALEECSPVTNENAGEFYDDLTEGNFTLPIIHAANTAGGKIVLNILRQKTHDISLKKYCKSLLEQGGSLQYTRDVMNNLDYSLRDEIARFGGNPPLVAVLDEMLSWRDA